MTAARGVRPGALDQVPETTFGFRKRLAFLLEQLAGEHPPPGRPLRVLDVGCGTGALVTLPLGRAGYRTVGLDLDLPSLRAGRLRSGGGVPFVCGETGAFRAGQFDVAICSEVLEHTADPVGFLLEVRRLLRPAGLLLVTVPNGYGPYEHTERLSRLYRRLRGRSERAAAERRVAAAPDGACDSLNPHSPHVQFFTWPMLASAFASAGFQLVAHRNRTVLCGAVVSELLSLHDGLVRANARLADLLPPAWVSDWMFSLRAASPPRAHYPS